MKMKRAFRHAAPLVLSLVVLAAANGCGNQSQPERTVQTTGGEVTSTPAPSSVGPVRGKSTGAPLTFKNTYTSLGATRTVELTIENGEFETLVINTPQDAFEVVASATSQLKIVLFTAAASTSALDTLTSRINKGINGRGLSLNLSTPVYFFSYEQVNGVFTKLQGAGITHIQVQVPANPLTRVTINNKVVKESINQDALITPDDIGKAVASETFHKLEVLAEMLRSRNVATFSPRDVQQLISQYSFDSEKLNALRMLKNRGVIAPMSYEEASSIARRFTFDENQALRLLLGK